VGLAAISLLAGACNGDTGQKAKETGSGKTEESGLGDAGDPVRGGRIVYGIEGETSGGFCLTDATLALGGNIIRNAIYDTLTVLDENALPKPFLAKSFTPDASFTTWTIGLRDGVKFHDGSTLDATVLKNNLDAYVGRNPIRPAALYPIAFSNIDTITVKDDLTVVVTTKIPWAALPAWLTIPGIMGQAQLDDEESCDTELIGTGPFKLSKWVKDQELLAQRNPDYWLIAPDGEPYPYADAIAFRPFPDSQQAINALDSGEINALVSANTRDIHGAMTDLRDAKAINLLISDDHAQVNYVLLNNGKAPFDDERMRRALAMGIDRDVLNDLTNDGLSTIANQPFPVGDVGYVDDPGYPEYDPEAAKALVAAYVADGGSAQLTITTTPDPNQVARVEVIQNMLGKLGLDVRIRTIDLATMINEVLAGGFESVMWSQHPGVDPDLNYVWWHVGMPTNFSRIDDPEINDALDAGRIETDPDKRREIYEGISRRFGEKVYSIWLAYSEWGIGLANDVHGVFSADLPDGDKIFTGLAYGHQVHGMWITS
jgi:peptide/nickel transport system substrate-binding protein